MKYKIIGKYQLFETETWQTEIYPETDISTRYIHLTTDGKLTLKAGYASDGSSKPSLNTKNAIEGAFLHDAFYELIRRGLLGREWKRPADLEAIKIWKKSGMSSFRLGIRSFGLRFAGFAADPKNMRKVYVTP